MPVAAAVHDWNASSPLREVRATGEYRHRKNWRLKNRIEDWIWRNEEAWMQIH